MQPPRVAVLLALALLAAPSAFALPEEEQPVDPAAPPAATKPGATGGGSESPIAALIKSNPELKPNQIEALTRQDGKALDAKGGIMEVPANAPQWVRDAMAKGLTPVYNSPGDLLPAGFDDPAGNMCKSNDDVMAQFGGQTPEADVTLGDNQETVAKGAQQVAAKEAGRSPKAGDLDFVGPLPQGFCDANAGAQVCKKEKDPPQIPKDPQQIADEKKEAAEKQAFSASQAGDVDATRKAIDDGRQAEEDGERARQDSSDNPETKTASTDPGAGPIGATGGHDLGPSGQVAGGMPGKRVRADSGDEARSLVAFQQGLKNGPLSGPSDPNSRSVARTAQLAEGNAESGAFSGAMRWARGLSERLGLNLGADVAAEGALDDQLATSPIDGAGQVRPSIKVSECHNDTLDGTAGGRTTRKVGGC